MATAEEKYAAVAAAVDALSPEDRQNGVKRFVAMFDAMATLLPASGPTPEPAPDQSPRATLLLSLPVTDEIKPDIERIDKELWTLAKKVAPT